ncbi:MAG: HlyD family secretion protein [Sphaerochaeta sp.]|uniref:HlyD family secretion protein n=1 Tax=Sphaerochaeta sp. TaxID=1972642 RepID=UPI003D1412B3
MKQLAIVLMMALTLVSCTNNEETTIAEGSLEANQVIVSAEGNGRIVSFEAVEGSLVAKGQVLGEIDHQQLLLQRKQLLASQKRVESQKPDVQVQLAPLQDQLATAKTEQERITRLFKADAASQKQLDDINAQVRTMSSQLAAQRLSLEQSVQSIESELASLSFQIAQLDDQIAKCTITSPIDGVLLTSYALAGEFTSIGRALFTVADLEHVYLRAYISADQLTTFKLGDTVTVAVDYGASEKKFYTGTLSWISEKAEFTPKTVQTRDERATLVYAIKVSLVNDGYLKLGMYGAIVEGK